jgi:hypothetical protein
MFVIQIKWKKLMGKSCFDKFCHNTLLIKDVLRHFILLKNVGHILMIDFYIKYFDHINVLVVLPTRMKGWYK